MELLRKHNTGTTIYFPMINRGAQDFDLDDWGPVAADCMISIDGATFANSTNVVVYVGQGFWKLVMTAAELNGAIVAVSIIDAATKSVEDQAIVIATYGNASASIEALPADVTKWLTSAPNALVSGRVDSSVGAMAANVLTAAAIAANALTAAKIATDAIGASQLANDAALEIADAILKRDMDQVDASSPVHSLCTAILKSVGRVRDNSGVEQTYRVSDDGLHMQRTLTPDATAQPIAEAGKGTA